VDTAAVGAAAGPRVAVGAGAAAVGATPGVAGGEDKGVGAAVGSGVAALHPIRNTTTAARPKLINRDILREIKLHQPTRAN
jgi:hypothetical protein